MMKMCLSSSFNFHKGVVPLFLLMLSLVFCQMYLMCLPFLS